MAPRKTFTKEQLLERKREAEKRRRKRRRNDPVLKELDRNKEHERYEERKKDGRIKLYPQLSDRERQIRKKKSKESSRGHNFKKKALGELSAITQPSSSTLQQMAPEKKWWSSSGGIRCSVGICRNSYKKSKRTGEQMMFFTFPKNKSIRKQWIANCYRQDKINADTRRICSAHFTPEDYEDELRARLLGLTPKKLKKTAVPSLHLHPSNDPPAPMHSASYIIKEESEPITNEILNSSEYSEDNESTDTLTDHLIVETKPEISGLLNDTYSLETPVLREPSYCSNDACEKLEKHCLNLEIQLRSLSENLQAERRRNEVLQQTLDESLRSKNVLIKKLKEVEEKLSPIPLLLCEVKIKTENEE